MKILCVGAGAIGGYFGGRLLQAGSDITFLLRPRRTAQIDESGLMIRSALGNATIHPVPHVRSDSIDGLYDLVIVSCKAYDLAEAMASFAPAVGPGTAILPLLNGIRHLDDLADRFGRRQILGGLCMISAALDASGAIVHVGEMQQLVFGELDGQRSARLAAIESEFARASFVSMASTTIRQELWEKWMFIASLGGINTLMRASVGDIIAAGAGDLALAMYDEAAAVGAAHGHAPREAAMATSRQILSAPGSPLTASLFKDIERGSRTEGEHIIGDLFRRGTEVAGGTPLLRLASAAVASYEVRRQREGSPR
ncbi:MAG: hypothetical protein MNPFHGCM_00413 [Gemmatimonadaceae bacterium]|nr:hypothetical protein [Gemmatimonadaceae bacterium]